MANDYWGAHPPTAAELKATEALRNSTQGKAVAAKKLTAGPNSGGYPEGGVFVASQQSGGPIPPWQLKLLQDANKPAVEPGVPVIPPWKAIADNSSAMAAAEFAAQLKLLDQQTKQATGQYNKAGIDSKAMYDSLAKDMRGEITGIKGNYAATGKSIGGAFNDAVNSNNAGFKAGRSELEAMAKRLGLTQALPQAEMDGYTQQQRLNGLLNSNKASATALNAGLGNNDVQYQGKQADIANFEGVNSKNDYHQKLLSMLGEFSNKKIDLAGDQSAAKNKYGLQIADMNSRSRSDWDKNQTDLENNRARNEIAFKNTEIKAGKAKQVVDKNLTAFQKLTRSAGMMYGNDPDAQKATKIIVDLMQGGWGGKTNWGSASEFVTDVLKSNPPAASSQLTELAMQFYADFNKGSTGAYGALGSPGRMDWNS